MPFAARNELIVLLDWCRKVADGDRTGIAVVHGIGGAGKTRLALELAQSLRGEAWTAGVLPKATDPSRLASEKGRVLVVLDYADGRVKDAIAVLKALRMRSGPPAIVVFTARSSSGQWLTDIIGSLDDDRHAYRREDIGLPDNHPNPRGIYARTVAALRPEVEERPDLPVPAPDTRWTTLDLVLLGWMTAAGETTLPTTSEELYDEVLRHEENYWCTVYNRFRTDSVPERALLRRAAACVSLVSPPEQDVDNVLAAISDLREDPPERRTVRRTLQTCLSPASGEGLAVRPDPVADHLLRELWRDDALVHRVLTRASDSQLETALLVMDRAGQDEPDVVTELLVTMVEASTGRWPALLTVAAERAGAAKNALERLADRPDSPVPLDELSAAIPPTSSLCDLGLIVDERRLARARALPAPDEVLSRLLAEVFQRAFGAGNYARALRCALESADRYSDLAGEHPATYLPPLAASLNNLGAVQLTLGHHDEALESSRAAIDILRQLAGRDPQGHSARLATSLSNLGNSSSRLGRHDEALRYCHEAVELIRDLMADDPHAHLRELNTSLQTLAWAWSRSGQYAKALECSSEVLESRRRIAGDDFRRLPEVAESLNNVGAMLLRLGRYDTALEHCAEAVGLYRELAANNPDRYLPDYAQSLYNFGGTLTKLERAELALQPNLEAVGIYQRLKSAAHRPDLAMSLNNLASALVGVNNYEEALTASRETVAIYRELATESSAWQTELAMSLTTLGAVLTRTNSHEDSLIVLQEAVTRYRAMTEGNQGFRADLARALNNLGAALSIAARPESSLANFQEALDLFRALGVEDPTAYLPELAASLHNYTRALIEARDFEQAWPPGTEAVGLYRHLATNVSDAYLPHLAASLHDLGKILVGFERFAQALPLCQEAVTLRRIMANHDPAGRLADFAASSDLLATVLLRAGWFEPALEHSQDAAACYQLLTDAVPGAYLPDLAGALHNVAVALCELGRHEQAVEPSKSVVDLYRRLAEGNQAEQLTNLARSLNNLGARFSESGLFEQALAPIQEAVDLRRDLTAGNADHLPDLAASLSNLGLLLSRTDQHEGALTSSNEALTLFRKVSDANPAYRLGLASALSNTGSISAAAERHEQALGHLNEAVKIFLETILVDPAASLPCLIDSLRQLPDVEAARTTWTEAFTSTPDDHIRAVLRTELARWAAAAGASDQARKHLRLAAQEADAQPENVSPALVGLARQIVRNAVGNHDVDDFPAWVTTALPDAHLDLLATVGATADWPSLRIALDERRDVLESSEWAATLNAFQALNPTDPTPNILRHVLEGIQEHGYDIYIDKQQTIHTRTGLIGAWTAKTSWRESAEFFHEHREAITDPEFHRMLSTIDSDVARQHSAIVRLATLLTVHQAYAIVSDPVDAEEATFDAIEAGDVARLKAIATAAPELRTHAATWDLISAVLLLAGNDPDEAMWFGRKVADQGSPILRRAHSVRLRSFGARNPDIVGVSELADIIDPAHGQPGAEPIEARPSDTTHSGCGRKRP